MKRTSGLRDLLRGDAILLTQLLWFMKEVDKYWDALIKKVKKEQKKGEKK